MAISSSTAWEVRTTGSDTNGGGFVQGATGTDYSQQDAAQVTYTDLVIDATTNTKATSAAFPFTAAHVGNTVNISSGTGFTVQLVQITAVVGVVATFERSLGTLGSTGGNGKLGGAHATIAKPLTVSAVSNIIFVKASATYAITANITLNNNQTPSNTSPPSQLIGYTTTRGDNGRATIQLTTNSNLIAIDSQSQAGWLIRNFVIDCNSLTNSTGVRMGFYVSLHNCLIKNFTTCGANAAGSAGDYNMIQDCEFTGGTSGAASNGAILFSTGGSVIRNYIHDNACPGIVGSPNSAFFAFNVIVNNSGATSDGIQINSAARGCVIYNNTFYNNGRDGINLTNNDLVIGVTIRNNIFSTNGRYGITGGGAAGAAAYPWYDGNAYYNNATGTRHFMDDTTVNPVNGAPQYTNVLDVTLSADPFTNTGTQDFTLNSTAGGGAACKAAATPGAMPGLSQLGYLDMGALQSQAAAGGTTTYVFAPNVTNYINEGGI